MMWEAKSYKGRMLLENFFLAYPSKIEEDHVMVETREPLSIWTHI
jgi:hypothetical protein